MRNAFLVALVPAIVFFAGCSLYPAAQSPAPRTAVPAAPTVEQPASPQATLPPANTVQPPPAPAVQPKTVTVTIANFSFNPATINIKAGDTVKWINDDAPPHKLFSASLSGFQSAALNTGDSYSFTFTTAGTYDYYCQIHPSMQGTVIVQ